MIHSYLIQLLFSISHTEKVFSNRLKKTIWIDYCTYRTHNTFIPEVVHIELEIELPQQEKITTMQHFKSSPSTLAKWMFTVIYGHRYQLIATCSVNDSNNHSFLILTWSQPIVSAKNVFSSYRKIKHLHYIRDKKKLPISDISNKKEPKQHQTTIYSESHGFQSLKTNSMYKLHSLQSSIKKKKKKSVPQTMCHREIFKINSSNQPSIDIMQLQTKLTKTKKNLIKIA